MIKTGSRRRSGPREDQLLQHRARLADAIKQGCSRPGLCARDGWGDHRRGGMMAAVKLMSWLLAMSLPWPRVKNSGRADSVAESTR